MQIDKNFVINEMKGVKNAFIWQGNLVNLQPFRNNETGP